jgi:putative ABC transport system permease protein
MDSLLQELRLAGRRLANAPAFTAAAVATLALGISVSTTMFSVVDSVLLRPLPFEEPERLVWMWGRFPLSAQAAVSPPDFVDYRARSRSFESLSAMVGGSSHLALGADGEVDSVRGVLVSAGFFETFGARTALGRTFAIADEQASRPQTLVLSHALWQRRFGGDPTVVGRAAVVDGRAATVVGVMPPTFRYPPDADVWMPLPLASPDMQVRKFHFLRPIGRLAASVSLEQAQAEVDTLARGLESLYPESNTGWGLRLQPLHEQVVGSVETAMRRRLCAAHRLCQRREPPPRPRRRAPQGDRRSGGPGREP